MEDSLPLILLICGILYLAHPYSHEKTNSSHFPEYVDKSGTDPKLGIAVKKVSGMIKKEEKDYLDELKKNIKFYNDPDKLGFQSFDSIINDNATVKKLNTMVDAQYNGVKSIVFYGPPGTGKTEAAKLICAKRGMYMISIKDDILAGRPFDYIPKFNILKLLSEELRPCMIFMDEMDGMFKSRSYTSDAAANVASAGATNYMLNFINDLNDAAKNSPPSVKQDLFIVGATNHIDKVDNAMISRMALQIEVKWESKQVENVLNKMLERCPGLSEHIKSFDITSAEINACMNEILRHYKLYTESLLADDMSMYNYGKEEKNQDLILNINKYYSSLQKHDKVGANKYKELIINYIVEKFKHDISEKMKSGSITGYEFLSFLVDKKRIHGRNLENKLNILCMYLNNTQHTELKNIIKNGNLFGRRIRTRRRSRKGSRKGLKKRSKRKSGRVSRRKSKKRSKKLKRKTIRR